LAAYSSRKVGPHALDKNIRRTNLIHFCYSPQTGTKSIKAEYYEILPDIEYKTQKEITTSIKIAR
jgi:hypothetical protein